jgi:hypothetical protein
MTKAKENAIMQKRNEKESVICCRILLSEDWKMNFAI